MNRPFSLSFACAAGAAVALSACQQTESSAPAETETVAAAPDAKPGLIGADARLVLPAVAERPGAVYFTLHNGSEKPVEIASVYINGVGKAEIHVTEGGSMRAVETVPVAAGEDVTFAPGGLHVMAFEIDPALAPGGAGEITLTFAGGDKLSMPLTIQAMGGAGMSGMAGMDHEGAN